MAKTQEIVKMKLDMLSPDKLNPRQEYVMEDMVRLEESIGKRGILNPILVEETDVDGKYLIVDGERRFRVARRLGFVEVPVRIAREKLTDQERLLVRFNLQEVHSPWTAWDKSVAIAELQAMTDWNNSEMSRQLGVSLSSINTLLALQKLSKRTISIAQKAKLPTESVSRIGACVKNMEPEKAKAVESAYISGVEDGKIFDRRTSNKFLLAAKRASVAQLQKFTATKKYVTDDILKETSSEHRSAELNLNTNMASARSAAKRVAQFLVENPKLVVQQSTVSSARTLIVDVTRLLKVIDDRVEVPKAK